MIVPGAKLDDVDVDATSEEATGEGVSGFLSSGFWASLSPACALRIVVCILEVPRILFSVLILHTEPFERGLTIDIMLCSIAFRFVYINSL